MSNLRTPASAIIALLRPYRSRVIVAAIALIVAAVAMLGVGQGLRAVIDKGFAAGDPGWLDRTLAAMFGVIAILAAATYTRFYNVSWLGERITADLRRKLFDHLLTLPPSWFESGRTGDVISRLTADTTQIEGTIGSSLSIALRNFLLLVGGLAMLFTTSLKLTMLVLTGVPLVVIPIMFSAAVYESWPDKARIVLPTLAAGLTKPSTRSASCRPMATKMPIERSFSDLVERGFGIARSRIRSRAWLIVTVLVLVFGAIALILWVGGHDVLDGRISPGQLSAFVFYAAIVSGSVGALSEVWGDLQRTAGATERLMEILATQPDLAKPDNPLPLPHPVRGEISFSQVNFRYPTRPDVAALDNFSLTVSPRRNRCTGRPLRRRKDNGISADAAFL